MCINFFSLFEIMHYSYRYNALPMNGSFERKMETKINYLNHKNSFDDEILRRIKKERNNINPLIIFLSIKFCGKVKGSKGKH